jgi:hypothetical protein
MLSWQGPRHTARMAALLADYLRPYATQWRPIRADRAGRTRYSVMPRLGQLAPSLDPSSSNIRLHAISRLPSLISYRVLLRRVELKATPLTFAHSFAPIFPS